MKKLKKKKNKGLGVFLLLVLLTVQVNAQEKGLHFEQLRTMALENNAGLKAVELKTRSSKALVGSAFDFEKTEVYYSYDQNNLAFNDNPLDVFGIQQSFLFPTVYFDGKRINKANLRMEESNLEIQKQRLEREKSRVYGYLDSIYRKFAHASQRRFELGETNYLEKITAEAKQKELQALYGQAKEDVTMALKHLQQIVQVDVPLDIALLPIEKLELHVDGISGNIGLTLYEQRNDWYKAKSGYEKQSLLPEINFDYFQGTNSGLGEHLYGYQVGLKIPLLFNGKAAKIKAATIEKDRAFEESVDYKNRLYLKYGQLMGQLRKYETTLSYYENDGQKISEEILKTATVSFQNGEIDFFQYIQSLENAYRITLSYLESLNNYNQTVIALNHLIL